MSEFHLTQSVYQNRQELRISRDDFDRYLAQVAQPLEAENKRLREALEYAAPHAQIALDALRNNPWPIPRMDIFQPLEYALQNIAALAPREAR